MCTFKAIILGRNRKNLQFSTVQKMMKWLNLFALLCSKAEKRGTFAWVAVAVLLH